MKNNVFTEIVKIKKYSSICKDTIHRTINKIIRESPTIKQKKLIKQVKTDLYKNHIAFFKNFSFKQAIIDLEKSNSKNTHEDLMRKYDNMRLKYIDKFYKEIFKITGKPNTLLDLGCGLNPLTLPWMNLDKNTNYYCYDIGAKQIEFLNSYFKLLKKPYKAHLQDVISNPPKLKADVAFLFKTTTCFEWQKPSNTVKLLKKLNVKYVVLTLLMRGNGNIKGSRTYFDNLLKNIIKGKKTYELLFKREYVFIIKLNKE